MTQNCFVVALECSGRPRDAFLTEPALIVASLADYIDSLISAATSPRRQRYNVTAGCDLARFEQRRAHFEACLATMPASFQGSVRGMRSTTAGNLADFTRYTIDHSSAPLRWVAELILEGGTLDLDGAGLVFLGDRGSISTSAYNIVVQMNAADAAPSISEFRLDRAAIGAVVDVLRQLGITVAPQAPSLFDPDAVASAPNRFTADELLAAATFMNRDQLRRSRIADPALHRELMLDDLHDRINAFLVRDEDDEAAVAPAAATTLVPLPNDMLVEFRAMLAEYY